MEISGVFVYVRPWLCVSSPVALLQLGRSSPRSSGWEGEDHEEGCGEKELQLGVVSIEASTMEYQGETCGQHNRCVYFLFDPRVHT